MELVNASQPATFGRQVSELDVLLRLEDDENDGEDPELAPCADPWRAQQRALNDNLPTSILDLQPLREQDRLLPVANVAYLMANELPEGAKVSKDAKCLMQEILSEFIGFITSEANDVCLYSKQKAITQMDVTTALNNMGAASNAIPDSVHPRMPQTNLARPLPTLRSCKQSQTASSADLGQLVPPIQAATQHMMPSPRLRIGDPSPKMRPVQPDLLPAVSPTTLTTTAEATRIGMYGSPTDCGTTAMPTNTPEGIKRSMPPLPSLVPVSLTPQLPPPKTALPLHPPLGAATSIFWGAGARGTTDASFNDRTPSPTFKRARTGAFNASDWIQSFCVV